MTKGEEIYEIAKRIFPICRSITGNGVRETLSILKEYVPEIQIKEVPSGTQVFDWTVPREWNIMDAYIEDEKGEKIIDFKKNNLHVLGYSLPMDKKMSLEELKKIVKGTAGGYSLCNLLLCGKKRLLYVAESVGFFKRGDIPRSH